MSATESPTESATVVEDFQPPADPRPRAATRNGQLLRAEISRLRHRRLVLLVLALAALALLGAMVAVFLAHSKDIAAARQEAVTQAAQASRDQAAFREQCLTDPSIPAEQKESACGPAVLPSELFFSDPRLRADVGLPIIALAVAGAGALVGALIGATAVGADWSSRALLTLLTWEPRRTRLLAARFTAVAVVAAVVGIATQAVGLGLGAVTVTFRGTWEASRAVDGDARSSSAIIASGHFWRDLVSLQVRGVGLVVLMAVLAAAVTMLTRHTAALLGLGFAWVALVENGVRLLFTGRGWSRWLLTENVGAYLFPGGQALVTGRTVTPDGSFTERTVQVSNLDALLYLGVLTAVAVAASALVLRRRDL